MTSKTTLKFGCMCAFAVLSSSAHGQIISQTPRPDVPPAQPVSTETISAPERIGRTQDSIKVTRPGALAFASFDRNSDFQIDMAEARAGIDRAFMAADKDKSGSLSLVELEGWRLAALGTLDAAPNNFAFAPNFARTVSADKFREVLMVLAGQLDEDENGNRDGKIPFTDLLKTYTPPRAGSFEAENCAAQITEVRRRAEQQCRNGRGY